MTNYQRSVGKFCSVTTASLASLALLDSTNLGNGAEAYVVATGRSYRYFLGSALTTMSPTVIRDSTSSGAWIEEDAVNDQSFTIEAIANAGSFSSTLNTWHAMPGGTSRYSAFTANTCWSVDTTTGIVTYNGPPANFLIKGYFSMLLNDVQDVYEFDLSRNGSSIGSTTAFASSSRCSSVDNSGALFCSHIGVAFITPSGTSYQHILRDTTASSTYQMLKYQATFTLLP